MADEIEPAATVQATEGQNPAGRASMPWLLLAGLAIGVVALAFLNYQFSLVFGPALLWGLALYITGILAGFVFGIPRVADRDNLPKAQHPSVEHEEGIPEESSKAVRRSNINSNLVEVSDWLTKIIVGVGLVELKQLPGYGESLATFMASGLTLAAGAPSRSSVSVAGAIALYFGVLGFVTGYLLTRIFLAVVMNSADRDAEEAAQFKLPAGSRISLPGLLDSFRRSIDDLQVKVGQVLAAEPEADANHGAVGPAMRAAAAPLAPSVTSILLWVDDNPARNLMIVDRLRTAGVVVDQVGSTKAAMDLLKQRRYGLVVTDMHRKESATLTGPSGIRLVRELRELFPKEGDKALPIVVYTTPNNLKKYGEEAGSAGANFVTDSQVELLRWMRTLYPSLI